ncbi:MAG: cation transporter [Bacteroidales bacterium]|nr:cation transporter [Bacteroidales bacterium]
MKHEHHHSHERKHPENADAGKNLLFSTLLNFIVSIAEIIGGLVSNSLALISDALHNLGDTSALFIAYLAHIISKKEYTDKKTFGYKRIEILAALFNAIVLVVIIVYLFIEAFQRLHHPEPIKSLIMLIVALIGFLANLISVLLLKGHSGKNINIRAAYLHLIGDTISSVVVIVTALLIYYLDLFWIDPLVTFLLGIYLLKETYLILKEALDILMQATPQGLDLTEVKKSLELIAEIDNIHHVHAWNLDDQDIHFECHIDLKSDIRISETEQVKASILEVLKNKFNISHVTIQYEYNCCDDKNMIHQK